MQLVSHNPYHILGLIAGSNQRTIEKQKGKINAYQKVGKHIEFNDDLIAIGEPDRSSESIEKAFSNIEINQSKLFHSLMWFVNHNHLDDMALNYIKANDTEKAKDIWEKIVSGKNVSEKNIAAFHNLGTLKIFTSTINGNLETDELLEAIRLKTEVLTSEFFTPFGQKLTDETYTANVNDELHRFINAILDEAKNKRHNDVNKLPGLISRVHPNLKDILSDKIADEPFNNIESILEQTKKKRTADPKSGITLARKLYSSIKDDLNVLHDILGKKDPKFRLIADKIAKEILQCGIDYFKEFSDDENLHDGNLGDDVMKLFKYANSISEGIQTKDRIKENIEGLQEWIDSSAQREKQSHVKEDIDLIVSQIETFESTDLSIQTASRFIRSCEPSLQRVREALGSYDEIYLGLSSGVVHNAQSMLVAVVNSAQEDFTMVSTESQMKRLLDTVKSARDVMMRLSSFGMVKELQGQLKANNQSLDDMVSQLILAKSRSQRQSSSGGCYIATMAYGSYEHPQVLELRKFRDLVLGATPLGRLFIKFYYKISPSLVQIFKDSELINKTVRSILNLFIRTIK